MKTTGKQNYTTVSITIKPPHTATSNQTQVASIKTQGHGETETRHHRQQQIASLSLAMTKVWRLKRGGAKHTSFKPKYITRRLIITQPPVIASRRRRRSKLLPPNTSSKTQDFQQQVTSNPKILKQVQDDVLSGYSNRIWSPPLLCARQKSVRRAKTQH